MKILYMGTPDFAVKPLAAIIEAGHEVCAVYTQPDKPQGRHFTLTPPPVKVLALEHNIPVYQPLTFKNNDEEYNTIKGYDPDCIVVAAYGRLLPQRILDIPRLGCINIHGSLLPKYRGAAPIQWSIINGDEETGVTTMYMAKELDAGDMLDQATTSTAGKTAGQLHDELSEIGADLILKTLEKLENGTSVRVPQDTELVTYAPMINRDMGEVSFAQTARQVDCRVRGLSPWPGAFTWFNGKKVKIRSSAVVEGFHGKEGCLLDDRRLIIGCADRTAIELLEVVPEGSKPQTGAQFLVGRRCAVGTFFGKEE